jgi:hypothetical protein
LAEQNRQTLQLLESIGGKRLSYAPDNGASQVLGHVIDVEPSFAYRALAFAATTGEASSMEQNDYAVAPTERRPQHPAEFAAVRAAIWRCSRLRCRHRGAGHGIGYEFSVR